MALVDHGHEQQKTGRQLPAEGARPSARIGPNAITRMTEALQQQVGAAETAGLFKAAELESYLLSPPQQMIDEVEVARLHQTVHGALDSATARVISRDAGFRTASYLLRNRIPGLAQHFLRNMPPFLASRALTTAIARNDWTFCGSGEFAVTPGNPTWLTISNCAVCRGISARAPVCDYYAACFERLFRALVSPLASVRETDCQACGADACRFMVRW